MSVKVNAEIATANGKLYKLSHPSEVLGCDMDFNVFLPSKYSASTAKSIPILYYLSGLTCTPNNCSEKGFLQMAAEPLGLAIVYPDTSPRGLGIAGEDDSWDFGTGAGFYVNATKEPYAKNYKMYEYVTEELPTVVGGYFDKLDTDNASITGHSMGGHGALTLFLKNPGKYKSVSAFAPISNPVNCPWGVKAFTGYFGEEEKEGLWKAHDATELIKKYSGPTPEILVDVGTGDNFYTAGQLLPENLEAAAKESAFNGKLKVNYREGYDHSYYFISTFGADHVKHAAKYLGLLDTPSL